MCVRVRVSVRVRVQQQWSDWCVCVCVALCLCVHKNEMLAADRPNNERQTTIYLVRVSSSGGGEGPSGRARIRQRTTEQDVTS